MHYKASNFRQQYEEEKAEEEKSDKPKGYFDMTACVEIGVIILLWGLGIFLLFKHGFAPLS